MRDTIEDILEDIIFDIQDENGNDRVYASQLILRLEYSGFMIVPIEDPTNLRFGVDD